MWILFRHTSRRNFIKDVHKAIGYIAPFDEEETKVILSRINQSKSPEDLNQFLSKPRSVLLFEEMNQMGQIQKIESLLDLKKFDTKIIENMSKKILKSFSSTIHKNESKENKKFAHTSKSIKDASVYKKFIYPLFNEASAGSSFVTFRVYPDSVAFVHFDRIQRKVLDIKSIPLKLNILEKKFQFEIHEVHDQMKSIVNEIPKTSFFIQEKSAPITSKNSSIPFRVALHTLNTIFMTLLYEIHFYSSPNNEYFSMVHKHDFVYNVKPSLVNNLFNLKIGSERISGSSKIQYHLRDNPSSPFYLDIDDGLWHNRFEQKSSMQQEKISQIILLTSAFDYVHKFSH
ncbi:uncharacterized protein [Lepeophtheirus salmonis]|nr:uncharacterized protein LOC121128771 [Lepeophtheirus salmonis]XP_040580323.1 uncharacterized protein LOC121128771 [Lepeophtheirus salmonis]